MAWLVDSVPVFTSFSCYGLNHLVRADCRDCAGCSECCRKMADTIILDPLDCFRLAQALSCSFDELLSGGRLELNMVDGIVLPNLKPRESDGCCPFLNAAGRCSIKRRLSLRSVRRPVKAVQQEQLCLPLCLRRTLNQ